MEYTKRRPNSFKIFSFCLACTIIFSFSSAVLAEVIFTHTSITIRPVITPIDESKLRDAEHKPRIIATGPLKLDVEIRPAKSFQMPSLYLTKTLKDNDAYLIPLPLLPSPKELDSPPAQHKIEPANVYAAIDILAIDSQGTILQIWPNLNLSTLNAAILLPESSHAVLYLAPNRSEQMGVTPKARVEHEMFTPPPKSLQ